MHGPAEPVQTPRTRKGGVRVQKWSRTVHVYTSMVCLVIVLFFSVTGVTLNHPNWAFGSKGSRETVAGTLPAGFKTGDEIDWLVVSEYFRNEHNVKGRIDSYDARSGDGRISFKAPGYAADAFFDPDKGTFDLTVQTQGIVAVMNDLHKGRDTGSSWKWVIDVTGGLLVLISASGLLLQLYLRKRRKIALVTAGAGFAVMLLLMRIAIG